ncbi:hypothetical protein VPNG_03570 [Cytospora leucostoma]|uniref:Uncharacterized protein n=1 Tax=Cytospora leucostoma TaxID=1230097 RepID=A0A423XCW2_9PEZI|nr:hypothetical protein VPNG_03570 [Cytospora leucostoma]
MNRPKTPDTTQRADTPGRTTPAAAAAAAAGQGVIRNADLYARVAELEERALRQGLCAGIEMAYSIWDEEVGVARGGAGYTKERAILDMSAVQVEANGDAE